MYSSSFNSYNNSLLNHLNSTVVAFLETAFTKSSMIFDTSASVLVAELI